MTHGTRLPQPAPAPRAPPAPGLVGSAPTQPPVVVQRQAGLEIYMAWGICSHCTAWVTRKGLKIPDLLCSTAMLGWKTAAAAVAHPASEGLLLTPGPGRAEQPWGCRWRGGPRALRRCAQHGYHVRDGRCLCSEPCLQAPGLNCLLVQNPEQGEEILPGALPGQVRLQKYILPSCSEPRGWGGRLQLLRMQKIIAALRSHSPGNGAGVTFKSQRLFQKRDGEKKKKTAHTHHHGSGRQTQLQGFCLPITGRFTRGKI